MRKYRRNRLPEKKRFYDLLCQRVSNLEHKMAPKHVGPKHQALLNSKGRMIGGLKFRNELSSKAWSKPHRYAAGGYNMITTCAKWWGIHAFDCYQMTHEQLLKHVGVE